MEPRSRFIEADGVKLHVADWGGGGPEVLLVHANGFLGRVYRELIRHLEDAYHVYTLDLRGQGDSDKPALRDSHWQDMAGDLAAVIAALGLQDFYGVGHSGGAALLAGYAASHAGRVKGLALLEPVTFPHGSGWPTGPWSNRPCGGVRCGTRADSCLTPTGQKPPLPAGKKPSCGITSTTARPTCRTAPFGSSARSRSRPTSLPGLLLMSRVVCPAVVIRGEQTDPPLFAVAEKAARRLPQGSLVTVPGTSHFLPMEKPAEVARIIRQSFSRG
ncbi:MAG: alpha/beta hydrolase [Desulfurellaceae bacterium]|nr:alpha/beta hydrolase [Desulfurellaceae bacterium]